MSATIEHTEVWCLPQRVTRSSAVPLPAHVLFQAGRSCKHNARAFKRYLGVLRGLHQPQHAYSVASLEEAGKCCLVCGSSSRHLANLHHHKGGPLFQLEGAGAEAAGLHGVYVEVNEPCDDLSRELMVCAACRGTPALWPPGSAERILRRHWRAHRFPYYESVWPRAQDVS